MTKLDKSLELVEKRKEHLNHPFYREAYQYRETVRYGQIMKGADKYPKPFDPEDWTAKQLIEHAMQENIDQAHYMYGLYAKLENHEQVNLEQAYELAIIDAALQLLFDRKPELKGEFEALKHKVKKGEF